MSSTEESKNYRVLFVLIIAGITGLSIWQFVKSSKTSDFHSTNIILEKNGKQYIYSELGAQMVRDNQIQNQSIQQEPHFKLFNTDSIYVEPQHLSEIISILSDSCDTHQAETNDYDGFVTVDLRNNTYAFQMAPTTDDNNVMHTLTIFTASKKDSMQIVWNKSSGGEATPVLNCSFKEFNVEQHPVAGETEVSPRGFVVVSIEAIKNFINNKSSLSYDSDENALYIKM